MNSERILITIAITAGLTIFFFGLYSGTPIDRYVSKSTDEAQIISLINTFHKSRTEYDLESYLACLNDNGSFMFGGGVMVSKNELEKLLPTFWADLESRDMIVRPFAHESQNGNFFDGSLYDPVITVEKQKAQAAIQFKTPIIRWKTFLFIDLKKQNGSWQINKFEWDKG